MESALALTWVHRVRTAKSMPEDGSRRRRVWINLLRGYRWMVTSNELLLAAAILIVGGSFTLSFVTGDWHWFQRSGALLVSIGAILSTRHVLRATITAMIEEGGLNAVTTSGGRLIDDADLAACFVGFWVVGLGTIIWAYGDLAGCLLGSRCVVLP